MQLLLLPVILVLTLTQGLSAENGAVVESSRESSATDELRAFLAQRLATYTWSAVGPDSPAFELTSDPVLRYTDPVREYLALGQLHLVLDGERPVAACSMWLNVSTEFSVREFSTLSGDVLLCQNADGNVVWRPQPAEFLYVPLTAAGDPAGDPRRRLVQMRVCARRFSATFFRRTDGEPFQLRFLPQPVYRFADPGHGITDGALFAFVESNDPDLLLLIAARTAPDGRESSWTYSLARMNSGRLQVRLDDGDLHEFPDYWQHPRSPGDQYMEADEIKYPTP